MKVRYREGLAIHPDPGSYAGVCEDMGVAVTGEDASRVLSREIDPNTSGCLRSKDKRGATSGVPLMARYNRTLRGLRPRARIEAHLTEDGRSHGWPQ